jgi:parallel beta-helix repeat protein
MRVVDPGQSCRHNVIRDNTIVDIVVRLVKLPAGPTVVDVPLSLHNDPENCRVAAQCRPGLSVGESDPKASIEDNLIEGNWIIGAAGFGIEIHYASRNRIANNTIIRVMRKESFPGVVLRHPTGWPEVNGSGIWVSPGSAENEKRSRTLKIDCSAIWPDMARSCRLGSKTRRL